jgi:type II secretory pathway pseudopilin PulG
MSIETSRRGERGTSLIELIVALLLLSLVTAAVASALLGSQRISTSNQRRMRALLLAASAIETARGGGETVTTPEGYQLQVAVAATGSAGLHRVDVEVKWEDGGEQSAQLSSLFWQAAPLRE